MKFNKFDLRTYSKGYYRIKIGGNVKALKMLYDYNIEFITFSGLRNAWKESISNILNRFSKDERQHITITIDDTGIAIHTSKKNADSFDYDLSDYSDIEDNITDLLEILKKF